ncbi:hypothetical protein V6N12_062054 [Hibiscus sabdariffa]|uniref:Uncharacterized protein n=1 Tax=Hibiscus sabdariffa TaxID=183260 RepID=A0ABR2AQ57_9ROSI
MDNAFYVEPIGITGGLAMWWSNEVKLSVLHHDKNLIDTVISINREVEWFGTFIYAPPYEKEKQEFWERLGTLRDNVNVKWCIMGDTNIVASPSEKYGGSPFDHNNAKWYHEFLERSLLMEIQSKGGAYTWSNQRSEEDEICEKLDKHRRSSGNFVRDLLFLARMPGDTVDPGVATLSVRDDSSDHSFTNKRINI